MNDEDQGLVAAEFDAASYYMGIPTHDSVWCGFSQNLRSGILPAKMPTYPLQTTCLGVICGTPVLASIFVGLRIYTRRKLNLRLGLGERLCSALALLC